MAGVTVEAFNAWDEDDGSTRLRACLDVPRWASELLGGRPYDSTADVLGRARLVAATLTPAEVDAALARHPRIGERAGAGHDRAFSEAEQAGVDREDAAIAGALADGNAAYESRFDRVFLIRAAGRPAEEILAELRRRMTNTPDAERAEVITQLREIALTRLETVLA